MRQMMAVTILILSISLVAQAQKAALQIKPVSLAELAAAIPMPGPAALMQSRAKPIADAKFDALAAAGIGAAITDVALTHRCLATSACHETNPMVPRGAGGYAFAAGTAAVGTISSYLLKKRHAGAWWIPQAVAITVHAVGIASGLKGSK